MVLQPIPSRADAAENLKAAAERLFELASMPVNDATQRRALVQARRALEDYEDASQRDLHQESDHA